MLPGSSLLTLCALPSLQPYAIDKGLDPLKILDRKAVSVS